MQPRIHFIYDRNKEPDASFAGQLINQLGQAEIDNASDIVTIGGDGMLLHAMRCFAGKKIMGIIPPGSNSQGFWTNKGIETASDVLETLENAQAYPITPMMAEIQYANKSKVIRYAYNDISIRAVDQPLTDNLREKFELTKSDVGIQSALLNLKVIFAKAVLEDMRIMGTGLIFATPFGSTAMNGNYGGPFIDIRNKGIVLTGMGIAHPRGGFNSIYNEPGTVFDIEAKSPDKRPTMVSCDSFGTRHSEESEDEPVSPVIKLKVSAANDHTVNLVLRDDPGLRAYSAMIFEKE